MMQLRQTLLAVALVTTLVASFVDFSTPPVLSPPQAQAKPVLSATPALPQAPSDAASAPVRQRFSAQVVNVFEAHSWQPPAPPPPKLAAPKAPVLPFRYLGKVVDNGQLMVFLEQSGRTYLVKNGDTLPGYKVVDITMADMTVVYVPLNETQKLFFESAN